LFNVEINEKIIKIHCKGITVTLGYKNRLNNELYVPVNDCATIPVHEAYNSVITWTLCNMSNGVNMELVTTK